MGKILDRLNSKKAKDLQVLSDFVFLYCKHRHKQAIKTALSLKEDRLKKALGDKNLILCRDCSRLLNHGMAKLLLCPYDSKPMCKKCKTQCYAPDYRERIRDVMKFSGLYLIKHGRLDLIVHYFM